MKMITLRQRVVAGLIIAIALAAVPLERIAADSRGVPAAAESPDCAGVLNLKLPDVRITEAVIGTPGQGAPAAQAVTVPHCKVSGVIGKEIRFTVLLPDNWNRGFFMGGGGGFVGSVENQAQASVNLGYATAGTDTGHQGAAFQAGWALNDVERQLNFGHLAVHRTAEVAKAIVRGYYGSDAAHSYFFGCSRGGGQAMMEAQRYPDDFDGIVASAPAMDWTGIGAQFVRNAQVLFPDPANLSKSVVTPENLKLLETKVLAACDALDHVKDGVMEDPRACKFDMATIPTCANDQPGPDCLTKTQHAAITQLYAPTTNREGVIYPGQPFGGEGEQAGWITWITGVSPQIFALAKVPSLRYAFGTELFKYFVFSNPAWDYTRYDLNSWKTDTRLVATFLNATNPNLDALKAKGRKLILEHGWSDPALTALGSVSYYEQVETRDPNVRDYFRMFMAPGVLHCGGGSGPDRIDMFGPIAEWVEKGKAPDRIIASKPARQDSPVRTRPLCVYPLKAEYTGSGSTDDAANFVCR